jgi:act minimal PKS acyl carrier protein
MADQRFTLDDLVEILLEGAGVDEDVDLTGDILDTGFDELGYESLALLETGLRIERRYGITVEDSVLIDASTPRALIDTVNECLAVTADAG